MQPREPPRCLQYHIPSITLEPSATHTLILSAMSCMFTLVFSVTCDFHSSCRKDHNATRAVCCFPRRKICLSCKQTGSCLHWASAALSIYNFVCTSLPGEGRGVGGGGCMVQAMSCQINVKVQADPLPKVPNAEQTTGYWGKNSTLDLSAEKSPPPQGAVGMLKGNFGFSCIGGLYSSITVRDQGAILEFYPRSCFFSCISKSLKTCELKIIS